MLGEFTNLALRSRDGDSDATRALWELAYDELRAIAHYRMRGERQSHTLTPTALVNEAYVRLAEKAGFRTRRDLVALATTTMQHVLIDHARRRHSHKRGGGIVAQAILDRDLAVGPDELSGTEIQALNDALERLSRVAFRRACVATFRLLEYQHDEIAEILQVSEPTVRRDWTTARAWLVRALEVPAD